MIVFGWMCMIALMVLGIFVLGVLVGPFIVAKIKSFAYRMKRFIEDEKIDIDKRSEERRLRAEKKRFKDFELENKKLDAKLNKVNKKVEIYNEKMKLAEELDKITTVEKVEAKPEVAPEVKIDKPEQVKEVVEESNEE